MSKLARCVLRLIAATVVIHLAYGLIVPIMREECAEIVRTGVVNSIDGHPRRES